MNIEKAIEEMKSLSPSENAIEVVLSELNNLKKIIDEMAGYIATLDIDEDICSKTQNEHCDKMSLGECESCIKKHFTKKVEGSKC